MKQIKTDGATPLTLHAIPGQETSMISVQETKSPLKPVKEPAKLVVVPGKKAGNKLNPVVNINQAQAKKAQLKVVYKEQMERMTNRDWTGLKKRLRFMLKNVQRSYDWDQEFALTWPNRIKSKAAWKRQLKEKRAMIRAFEMVLSFEGRMNGYLTQADFKPKDYYRFYEGKNRIYDHPWDDLPTINLDKHPDAMDEVKRAQERLERLKNSQFEFINPLKRDNPYPFWRG